MIQRRFALSEKGAKDFCKGIVFTTLLNISLMLPAIFVFAFLDDWIKPLLFPGTQPETHIFYYIIMSICFIAVMYFIAVLQYRSTYTTVYTESANRRIELAEKLRRLPLAFFGEKNLSDLTAMIMADCTDLEHTFSHAVPQLFASFLSILLIAVGMALYDWRLTIALFWVVPVALSIVLLSRRKIKADFRKHYYTTRDVSEQIQEGLENMQEIKACNRELDYENKLDFLISQNEKIQIKGELLVGVLIHGAQSILKLGIASVIIVGVKLLVAGEIGFLPYLFFLVLGSRVYEPVAEVMNNIAALSYLDVRINRMREMENMPVQQGKTRFSPNNFDIVFSNVSFAYDKDKQVLHNLSFVARQGEITALVGPSGGGKTTAAKLAARFWDVEEGKITLGGEDIATIDPETLLQHYAVVFQDVVLFNASIMDNIRIGRSNATDEEVMRAAKVAQCDEFVERLSDGYATVIGENGVTLSGGERQRISIARALLKDAPVILLDEATASLDVENETKIQTAISELIRDKTVIIIAHRMRTVADADKIVVLKDGIVAETGTPSELINNKGVFASMFEKQISL